MTVNQTDCVIDKTTFKNYFIPLFMTIIFSNINKDPLVNNPFVISELDPSLVLKVRRLN